MKMSKTARAVHNWLQDQAIRPNAGPTGDLLKTPEQIANGVRKPVGDVQEACIELAGRGLLSRVTPDGRVAA